jgi:hypothetical protein
VIWLIDSNDNSRINTLLTIVNIRCSQPFSFHYR